ncbi:MAG TPA: carbon storage regulator [Lacipirellulaceae bacterium]|nr:carbon storage regulator [Lacipirellulaceae bacterium]HMP05241.1 carbon storage regulator [Lacipirellulaceae bacterium]
MLVLTRKQGEKIRIGDDIVITVVRTKGKAARLGIEAPAHVPVLRGEIALAVAADALTASMAEQVDVEIGDNSPLESEQLDSRNFSGRTGTANCAPLSHLVAARH